MRGRWILKGLGIFVLILVVLAAAGWVVMSQWNWLIPPIVGWKAIDFVQAVGLLVQARLRFGGRGFGWHHHRGHHRWKQRMAERWMAMTPEEREKFKEGMRGRCGHWHGRHEASPDSSREA